MNTFNLSPTLPGKNNFSIVPADRTSEKAWYLSSQDSLPGLAAQSLVSTLDARAGEYVQGLFRGEGQTRVGQLVNNGLKFFSNKAMQASATRLSLDRPYIYNQPTSSSSFIIGPLSYSYSVQGINVVESRAVESVSAGRSNKGLLVDGGAALQKATVQLLFSDISDINEGLRPLILLFKSCPIVSVKNELLSETWKNPEQDIGIINNDRIRHFVLSHSEDILKATNEVFKNVEGFKGEKALDNISSILKGERISNSGLTKRAQTVRDGTFFLTLMEDYSRRFLQTSTDKRLENRVRDAFAKIKVKVTLSSNAVRTSFIPVAFESISIQSAPDLVNAYLVTLTLTRIDVSSATGGVLNYQGLEPGMHSPDPRSAYWLKKWLIEQSSAIAPVPEETGNIAFEWISRDQLGNDIKISKSDRYRNNLISFTEVGNPGVTSESVVSGFSYTLSSYFAYQRLTGKQAPCAQHMGYSARSVSMDLIFETKDSSMDSDWSKFLRFKDLGDAYMHNQNRKDRITGWTIYHPILKLLDTPKNKDENAGVFVPLNTIINTSSTPSLKHVSIDLMENNIDFFTDMELTLYEGASDEKDLRDFFEKLMLDEHNYRFGIELIKNPQAIRELADLGADVSVVATKAQVEANAYAFEIIWPTHNRSLRLNNTSQRSIVNMDTLRAVLLHPNLDITGRQITLGPNSSNERTLQELLRATPLATGRVAIQGDQGVVANLLTEYRNIPLFSSALSLTNNSIYEQVYKRVGENILKMFDPSQHSSTEFITFAQDLTRDLYVGLLGDRDNVTFLNLIGLGSSESASGRAVANIARTSYKFSALFNDTLFELVTRRPGLPRNLRHVYKQSGVESAFFTLYIKYESERNRVLANKAIKRDLYSNPEPGTRHYLYPDLYLPTYIGLFGKDYFDKHAPTFDDLGLNAWLFSDQDRLSEDDSNQNKIAVFYEDKVHPAVWFYKKRFKPDLRVEVEKDTKALWGQLGRYNLSIPFNTDSIGQALGKDPNNPSDLAAIKSFINKGYVTASDSETLAILKENSNPGDRSGLEETSGVVVRVTDGDSIVAFVEGREQKIRLLGVDTPEESQRRAQEAKDYLSGLVSEGEEIIILYDPGSTDQSGRGAILAHVINSNNINVNLAMAQSGFLTQIPLFQITDPRTEDHKERANKLSITLSRIIRNSVEAYKQEDPFGFDTLAENLSLIASKEEYIKKYMATATSRPTHDFYIQLHHADNHVLRSKAKAAFLGSEIYRVVGEMGSLGLPQRGTTPGHAHDMTNSSPETKHRFIRGLEESTLGTVKSSITQTPDDFESPVKLWPTIKVYLIDHRGNDIIASDILYGVTPIISLDITLDKDDAGLAVLQIADPLYSLQRDYFTNANVVGGTTDTKVLGFHRTKDFDAYLRRHKIAQGRSIQIRMGYDSVAENLPIVFTGRITEIEPGDVLTIIAQDWKAELISRKVAFSNTKPVGWGAQDLCIQAIQHADPDGIGQHFPPRDAEFILRNIKSLDQETVLRHIAYVSEDSPSAHGIVSVADNLEYQALSLGGILNIAEPEKRLKGIDTRLKNIWYPDVPTYSNTLSWRTRLGVMPEFINDGWIIPLQSAWDAVKEASRHAWNCIAQVVPYDGEATLFFGHPDQPYFFTRGPKISKSKYRRYANRVNEIVDDDLAEIVNEFFADQTHFENSANLPSRISWFLGLASTGRISGDVLSNPQKAAEPGIVFNSVDPPNVSLLEHVNRLHIPVIETDIKPSFKLVLQALATSGRNSIAQSIDSSGLPEAAYLELRSRFGGEVDKILVQLFYGLDSTIINRYWQSIYSDLGLLIASKSIASAEGPVVLTELRATQTTRLPEVPIQVNLFREFATVPATDVPQRARGTLSNNLPLSSVLGRLRVRGVLGNQTFLPAGQTLTKSRGKENINASGVATLKELLINYLPEFKAFVFFFSEFLKSTTNDRITNSKRTLEKALDISSKLGLEPNMQVFRVHHWIDSEHEILKNNIVASTREMWNTVSIEHPESADLANTLGSAVNNPAKIHAGIEWVYYPKQEVTQVIGLQFHPGLSLANKKLKIFTELNCSSEELAAKLACTHLADGIRRMYRGTLTIRGRHIKPHDRIILRDNYSQISGVLEVESVVHHWSAAGGWVTNIIPQAVCDANAGAAAIQTAIKEASFKKIFGAIDTAFDVFMWAGIVASLGSGTGLAFGIRSGLSTVFKSLWSKKGFSSLLKNHALRSKNALRGLSNSTNPLEFFQTALTSVGGLGTSLTKGLFVAEGSEELAAIARRFSVINSFTAAHDPEGKRTAHQLPVTLSPLMYQGLPWTAGLEADESIIGLNLFSTYYSWRDFMLGLENLRNAEITEVDEILEELKSGN